MAPTEPFSIQGYSKLWERYDYSDTLRKVLFLTAQRLHVDCKGIRFATRFFPISLLEIQRAFQPVNISFEISWKKRCTAE